LPINYLKCLHDSEFIYYFVDFLLKVPISCNQATANHHSIKDKLWKGTSIFQHWDLIINTYFLNMNLVILSKEPILEKIRKKNIKKEKYS
jgi:hypothetical protein